MSGNQDSTEVHFDILCGLNSFSYYILARLMASGLEERFARSLVVQQLYHIVRYMTNLYNQDPGSCRDEFLSIQYTSHQRWSKQDIDKFNIPDIFKRLQNPRSGDGDILFDKPISLPTIARQSQEVTNTVVTEVRQQLADHAFQPKEGAKEAVKLTQAKALVNKLHDQTEYRKLLGKRVRNTHGKSVYYNVTSVDEKGIFFLKREDKPNTVPKQVPYRTLIGDGWMILSGR